MKVGSRRWVVKASRRTATLISFCRPACYTKKSAFHSAAVVDFGGRDGSFGLGELSGQGLQDMRTEQNP